MVKIKNKDFHKILGSEYIHGDPEEIIETNFKNISDKLKDFDYKCDKDENMITLVGEKPEEITKFNFKDLDKGLEYKDAKDLDSLNFHYPSVMAEKSISKINRKLEKAQEKLSGIKMDLRNRAGIKKKKGGLDFAFALNDKPQTKTLERIDKHNILERYAHSLNNLKVYKENIQSKTGSGILPFSNPLQLLDRLELLSGSILAGNNGVIQEFSQIAHLLNQMKVLTKKNS